MQNQQNLVEGEKNSLSLSFSLERNSVHFGVVERLWLNANISANLPEGQTEPDPLTFLLLIDTSGSMKADQKFITMLSTIEFLIDQLDDKCRLGIITFNSIVQFVTSDLGGVEGDLDSAEGLVELTDWNKSLIRDKLRTLQPEGSTNLSDAIKMALDVLYQRNDKSKRTTIMLFTDGLPNVGKIGNDLRQFLDSLQNSDCLNDVKIHTFGFGLDHDSRLLTKILLLSRDCGLYHYIENTSQIATTFAICLGSILSTVFHRIKITAQAHKSCRIINSYTKYQMEEEVPVKRYSIYLGSISNQESRNVLLKLNVNKVNENELCNGYHDLVTITLEYTDVATKQSNSVSAKIPIKRNVVKEEVPSLPLEIEQHLLRFESACAIESAIREISTSVEEDRFQTGQLILDDHIKKIKDAKEFAKTVYGERLISHLNEVYKGMSNPQIFSAGLHYAYAFAVMYFMEQNNGVDNLNIDEVIKRLKLPGQVFTERRRYSPAYATYAQQEQTKRAQREIPRYVEGYLTPEK